MTQDRRPPVVSERQVGSGVGQPCRADRVPVLGDVGQAGGAPGGHRGAGDVRAGQGDRAAGDLAEPGDRLDELALPVAGHARDAHDLAGAHGQVHPVDRATAVLPRDDEAGAGEHRIPRFPLRHRRFQDDVASRHGAGDLLRGGLRGDHPVDDTAVPQHGDPVRDRHDLLELVRDEDDGAPVPSQRPKDLEQPVGLLRGEHRRRFVQDEHRRLAVERLDDLDPLQHPDGKLVDARGRVDGQPVALGDLGDPPFGRTPIEPTATGRLLAVDHVLGDRQGREQLERLEDHPQTGGDGVPRRGEVSPFAAQPDLPVIGLVEAEQDGHQRRLAGTVLPHQGVDLTVFDVEVDVVVGEHTRKALRDAAQFQLQAHIRSVTSQSVSMSGIWRFFSP